MEAWFDEESFVKLNLEKLINSSVAVCKYLLFILTPPHPFFFFLILSASQRATCSL